MNKSHPKQRPIIFDITIVTTITLITWFIGLSYDLSEKVYLWTRIWEKYQADELFFPLISFSLALIWFSWRRAAESKSESKKNLELLNENRQLIQKITQTQERERLYLAQELHDEFSQYLIVLRTQAEYLQTLSPLEHESIRSSTQHILENVAKLHTTTRTILKNLRPALLDFGVVMAIEDLVTEWQLTHTTILCNLEFDGVEPELSEQELLVLYRTIQEGLSNIAKHSQAEHVDIKLFFPSSNAQSPATITLHIINDGTVSFEPDTIQSGLGLIGIRERVGLVNGSFSITALSPTGTQLELSFPIHQADKID